MQMHLSSPEDASLLYALDTAMIVAHTDGNGNITNCNDNFCKLNGYPLEELIGCTFSLLCSGINDKAFLEDIQQHITAGKTWVGELCFRTKKGSLSWVKATLVPYSIVNDETPGYTAICTEITDRKQLESNLRVSQARLAQLSSIDPLTGLANRVRFTQQLEMQIADFQATGRPFHLALLDVDSFRELNEFLGYSAGDLILKTVSQRIMRASDGHVFISRMGADEFAVIITGANDNEARAFYERILHEIREPIYISATAKHCSASIGTSIFPQDAADAESLIIAADLALSHAKTLGRDRIEAFEPSLREAAERKAVVLKEIGKSLRQGEFTLFYQPIASIHDPNKFSLEALLRWHHPELGLMTPAYFAVGLEDQGVSAALGMFVLRQTFKDIQALHEQGIRPERVGINLTNSDFRSDSFIDKFFDLCAATEISPSQFSMEVTEGMLLGHYQKRVESGLRRLHEAGAEVAMDDFGTGYASLTHLRRLPTDRLKIDISFVRNMTNSPQDRAIVAGIIDIAHSLNKSVTAEGVETLEQVTMLRSMRCDQLQGWYFGKASPVDKLAETIKAMPRILEK